MIDIYKMMAASLRLHGGVGSGALADFLDPPANDAVPPAADTIDADELLIDTDDAEAERFRLECERDQSGENDW